MGKGTNEMRSSAEISIDLSTEELLQDVPPVAQEKAAGMRQAREVPQAARGALIESPEADEIELTPEQIDTLLSKPL